MDVPTIIEYRSSCSLLTIHLVKSHRPGLDPEDWSNSFSIWHLFAVGGPNGTSTTSCALSPPSSFTLSFLSYTDMKRPLRRQRHCYIGHTYLPLQMFAGSVEEWSELVALGVIIGVFEAGFIPASVYLIATWYSRYEIHKKMMFSNFSAAWPQLLVGTLLPVLSFLLQQLAKANGLAWTSSPS